MISLFLNTSSRYLNIAILKDNKVINEKNLELEKDLSALALFEIEKLFKETQLKPNDIDEIYCVDGPGSFTGLRVGITIAKVYAWSLNKKLYKVSSLYTMATSINNDYIIPLIDARRGYVFAGIYDKDYNQVLKDQYISLENLKNIVENLEGQYTYVTLDDFDFQTQKYIPNLNNTFKYIKKEEADQYTFIPNYLKKTEAEEKLNNDTTNK